MVVLNLDPSKCLKVSLRSHKMIDKGIFLLPGIFTTPVGNYHQSHSILDHCLYLFWYLVLTKTRDVTEHSHSLYDEHKVLLSKI